MLNPFSRTELLIGKAGLEKLQKSRVAVFGLGGVGGYVVEALVRSGLGAIDIIDNDTVSITNLNRQIYALDCTIGKYKTDVAEERIKSINSNCKIKKYTTFFSPENSSIFDFSKYDYVVDAIDTVSGKIELVVKANESSVPIISSMGAGNKLHPEMFEIEDIYKTSVCPLAKVMRQELKKRRIKKLKVVYSKEPPIKPNETDLKTVLEEEKTQKTFIPASCSFVPPTVGLIIAGEVIRDIIKNSK